MPAVNLPNSITLTRIFSIPLLIWLLSTNHFHAFDGEQELLASALFIAASITDGIDGYLARRRGQITTMGMLLDPLADKLLIAAAFICAGAIQSQPGSGVGGGGDHRARISGERIAFDCRFGRFHHRSQRTGQIQNAGADCFRGRGDSRSSLESLAGGPYIFPVHWIAFISIWFMVFLSLVSAIDYFAAFWSKIDRHVVKRRRRAFVLSRRRKRDVPAI